MALEPRTHIYLSSVTPIHESMSLAIDIIVSPDFTMIVMTSVTVKVTPESEGSRKKLF